MEQQTDLDYPSALHFALVALAQAKMRLAMASWAAPETIDTIEHLRMSIDTLAKRIKRERARWERERNEN